MTWKISEILANLEIVAVREDSVVVKENLNFRVKILKLELNGNLGLEKRLMIFVPSLN